MRLAGGVNRNEGRVEMLKDGTWGTICDPDFTSIDGLQVALELSRSSHSSIWNTPSLFGSGTGDIKISNIICEGQPLKESIFDCPHSEGASGCTHANDISIRMNTGVRIYGTIHEPRGPVGVFRERVWSKVCANDWDIRDAHVLCRELKYPGAIMATKIPRGTETSPVIRGGYRCEGYELTLEDCERGSVQTPCTHDAGVVCQTLRLADGPSPHIGRLEIFRSGAFGGICDSYWDDRDANVACIQLGFLAGVQATYRTPPDKARTSGFMWMSTLYCGGLEKNLFDCGYKWDVCSTQEEVWVECVP